MIFAKITRSINNLNYWSLLSAISVVLCFPVITTTYPALVDYHNHLARSYILYHYKEDSLYASLYYRVWEPIPNSAIDLIVPVLLNFVGILTASKLFLTLTVLLFIAGCHYLGKAIHGNITWMALPCCFFVYNSMFLYGFINYVFSVALFCIAFACWLNARGKWSLWRFLAVTVLVFAAYLAHLSAYCFLGVALVIVRAWDFYDGARKIRGVVLDLLPLVPPLLAFVVFMRGSGQAGKNEWNTVGGKLIGGLSLVLSYNYTFDAISLVILGGILAALIYKTKRLQIAWPVFTAGMVFFLLYLICPKVMFTSSAADARFVLPAALLLVLSLKPHVPAPAAKLLLLAFLVIVSLRICAIWKTWTVLSGQAAAEVSRLQVLPEGAAVYPIFVRPKSKLERSFEHIIQYATINRHAYVPTLFALQGQQPLLFRSHPRGFEVHQRYASLFGERSDVLFDDSSPYTHVWSYNLDEFLHQQLSQRCTVIYEADGFALWRIN